MERPKHGSEWRTIRSGMFVHLENSHTDPITGVITTWRRNPKPDQFTESKEDKLPNSSLYRFIYYEAKPDGEIEEKSYTIGSNKDGLSKSIKFTPLLEAARFDLIMRAKEEESSEGFSAYYKGNKLSKIEIDHSSFKLPAVLESLHQRHLSVNLKELAQLYREYGKDQASFPDARTIQDEQEQKEYVDNEKSDRRKKTDDVMKNWTEKEKAVITVDIHIVVRAFVSRYLSGEFQNSEIDEICDALSDSVLEALPSDYNTQEKELLSMLSKKRRQFVGRLLSKNVVFLLASNRTAHDNLFDLMTDFRFGDDEETVEVEMMDGSTMEPIHQGRLKFGDSYRYDNYNYSIERDDEGKVTTAVSHIARPDHRSQIRIPQTIDLQEFTRLITLPDSIGWEKALDVADIDYEKT